MFDDHSAADSAASSLNPPIQQQQQQQQLAQLLSGKDSRWLQLEVCRKFQRGQCTHSEQDCKYAHPPPHVEVQNGRVTACYDSIKGRCTRENPRCKYLHPPQHLKDQLLANGKQNLVMKNLLSQQISQHQCSAAAASLPALAQIVQHPGAPLGLQSAAGGLPLQYFIPGLFPGFSQADPFGALQNMNTQQSANVNPAAALLAAQQFALLQQHYQQQQQQQQVGGQMMGQQPATALLLAQQQMAQAVQAQQQQQQLLQLALLQQHQQQQLAAAAMQQAAVAQTPEIGEGGGGRAGRKRSARVADIDQQQDGGGVEQQQQQHLQMMAQAAAAHASHFQPSDLHILQANGTSFLATGAKRQKAENGGTGNGGAQNGLLSSVTSAGLSAAAAAGSFYSPQFNPYLVPAAQFLPAVSFAGQLPPPRF